MSATTEASTRKRSTPPARIALQIGLVIISLVWLFPLLWALFNSFRDYSYTVQNGYLSFGGFTFDNYINAWNRGGFTNSFLNSAIITITAVVLTLALSSCAA